MESITTISFRGLRINQQSLATLKTPDVSFKGQSQYQSQEAIEMMTPNDNYCGIGLWYGDSPGPKRTDHHAGI
ncbi:MAG: hypothetical protein WBF33_29760 [Candidatus Nitrosopolaris sp.]